jgi:hypothetical protein
MPDGQSDCPIHDVQADPPEEKGQHPETRPMRLAPGHQGTASFKRRRSATRPKIVQAGGG